VKKLSLRELSHLKNTLSVINSIAMEEKKLEEEIQSMNQKKRQATKFLLQINKKLEAAIITSEEHEEWIIKFDNKIKHNDQWQSKAESKFEDFVNENQQNISDNDIKINTLRNYESGNYIFVLAMFIIFSGLISGGVYGYYSSENNSSRGEWVCDDGQVIDLLDVWDGTIHCSDGSDEAESGYFQSETRAEEAYYSDEHSDLNWAELRLQTEPIFMFAIPGVILLVFAFWYHEIKSAPIEIEMKRLVAENQKLKQKKAKLESKIDSWKLKTWKLTEKKDKRERRIKDIPGIKKQKVEVELNVGSIKSSIIKTILEIEKCQTMTAENWDSIKHLIPLGLTF